MSHCEHLLVWEVAVQRYEMQSCGSLFTIASGTSNGWHRLLALADLRLEYNPQGVLFAAASTKEDSGTLPMDMGATARATNSNANISNRSDKGQCDRGVQPTLQGYCSTCGVWGHERHCPQQHVGALSAPGSQTAQQNGNVCQWVDEE